MNYAGRAGFYVFHIPCIIGESMLRRLLFGLSCARGFSHILSDSRGLSWDLAGSILSVVVWSAPLKLADGQCGYFMPPAGAFEACHAGKHEGGAAHVRKHVRTQMHAKQ